MKILDAPRVRRPDRSRAADGARAPAALGQAKARIVVIGGGIGGATVARYLATSEAAVDVTLVEPRRTTRPASSAISISPDCARSNCSTTATKRWRKQYGITVVHESATAIDPAAKSVALENGSTSATTVSSSLRASRSRTARSRAMTRRRWRSCRTPGMRGRKPSCCAGNWKAWRMAALFVIVVPPNPFRCPPAPYERASLVASYFKQQTQGRRS